MSRAKGSRKTGGRQKGTPNRKTAAIVKALERSETLTAERVLEELRRLSFSNVQDLFDEVGNLRPIQDLTRDQASCIASLEIIKKNAEAGDGHIDVVHKLKIWDKTRTLDLLAKHFALLTERIHISGKVDIVSVLRKRFERQSKPE